MLIRKCLFESALQGHVMGLGAQSDDAVQGVRCMKWLQVSENNCEWISCSGRRKWSIGCGEQCSEVSMFVLNFKMGCISACFVFIERPNQ